MAHQSFAGRVYEKLRELAGKNEFGRVEAGDLSSALLLPTKADHKRMLNALCDLRRAGKVARVEIGVYRVVNGPRKPEIREVMWRILRMRKRVSVDDLAEMAEASRDYARQWLNMLVDRNVVKKVGPNLWQLVDDQAEMPVDTDKADKLRELRRRQKQKLISKLDAAKGLLEQVRAEIEKY